MEWDPRGWSVPGPLVKTRFQASIADRQDADFQLFSLQWRSVIEVLAEGMRMMSFRLAPTVLQWIARSLLLSPQCGFRNRR